MKYTMSTVLFIFLSVIHASGETAKAYCEKLKKGDVIQIDTEKRLLRSNGLKVETAIAGEAGHNTWMLMISSERNPAEKCDVIIRDSKVAEIRL